MEDRKVLKDSDVVATVAVSDREESKKFYNGVLGLEVLSDDFGGVMFKSGAGRLFMYEAPTAGTGKATCATWEVKDVKAVVDDLSSKGQKFEHYDMPQTKLEGDIHIMGPAKAAWLKDPSGNVLAFIQMS